MEVILDRPSKMLVIKLQLLAHRCKMVMLSKPSILLGKPLGKQSEEIQDNRSYLGSRLWVMFHKNCKTRIMQTQLLLVWVALEQLWQDQEQAKLDKQYKTQLQESEEPLMLG